jgi:membrane protein implicated in regulation of membrane protease activity
VIGAVFFAALGRHSGRAGYAHAAAGAVWIDLALTLVIAVLTAILAPRPTGKAADPAGPASTAPDRRAVLRGRPGSLQTVEVPRVEVPRKATRRSWGLCHAQRLEPPQQLEPPQPSLI